MEEHLEARYIVETLTNAGFVGYYAGGWVRDLLLQLPSDDIDIATNAPPETIQSLFPKTVPIGIAFGIILVLVNGRQYEVATFRQDFDYRDGRRPSRIAFTTAEEDAKRRDFTINGMFYDPIKKEVLDFVGGKADLEKKMIRAIGNPHQRIQEDRLRMIRALRLACRFEFQIEPNTEIAIRAHANELFPAVAIERVVQELEKGKASGKLSQLLIQLHEFGLLGAIFPELKRLDKARIEKRLESLLYFPLNTPLIVSLLELFPDQSLEFRLQLCQALKLSSWDQQVVTFLFQAERYRPTDLFSWAHFYANTLSPLTVQILAARLEPEARSLFLQEHETRRHNLHRSIYRIQTRHPVVKSTDLIAAGIQPGKKMGLLLKEAERMAINEQIEEKEIVLQRLKKYPLWNC